MSHRRRKPHKPRSPRPQTQQTQQADAPAPQTRKHFETQDVPPRPVLYLAAGLFAGIIVSGALVAGLLTWIARASDQPQTTSVERQHIAPPPPRLEVAPEGDRARVEADAARLLQGYAWTDKAAGRARIPIEEAMRLTASQGWQDPPPEAPQP